MPIEPPESLAWDFNLKINLDLDFNLKINLDLFSDYKSGLSGRDYDTRHRKFGLSRLAACHVDWCRRKAEALLSPSGTLPVVWWVNIVKRQVIVLRDP